jgi:hypothetical protein
MMETLISSPMPVRLKAIVLLLNTYNYYTSNEKNSYICKHYVQIDNWLAYVSCNYYCCAVFQMLRSLSEKLKYFHYYNYFHYYDSVSVPTKLLISSALFSTILRLEALNIFASEAICKIFIHHGKCDNL